MSFLTDDLNDLAQLWLKHKQVETAATENRRLIEDRMKSLIGVAENFEGTETAKPSQFEIKITGRIDRKVDSEKLQELAAEAGLSEHLSRLFRWTPEINMAAWKSADEAITRPLAAAITAKAGRASFKITAKE